MQWGQRSVVYLGCHQARVVREWAGLHLLSFLAFSNVFNRERYSVNLEARGSACTPSFAYVKLSPDCSVLGQCWTKHCSFTILTLNIHMEYKREYKRSGTGNPILGERNEASRKKKLQ